MEEGSSSSSPLPILSVLMEEEDVVMMAWVLIMQKYGLSMTLQQLQMKMENFI